MNIARTTLSSKILTQHKDFFAKLAVEAVERLKGSGNLEAIQVIKKLGGGLEDSYLEEGELVSYPHSLPLPWSAPCLLVFLSILLTAPTLSYLPQVSCWRRRWESTSQRDWRMFVYSSLILPWILTRLR